MNKKENKKEFNVVCVGPLLVQCLNKQIELIKRESYGVIDSSYYNSGEILAKKILENRLI